MAYQVRFSETTNPAKPTITVNDQSLNTETSLTFVGKNYAGYAPIIAENFLHLLENFAKNTAPDNPVQGQLWYDNNADVNLLKVYDGTQWVNAGSVKKASSAPGTALAGDLWADTVNQQLYLYSGSAWLLVGPQFSAGTKTGPTVETIVDTVNVSHSVLSFYANNNRIAIVSKEAFTPKASIAGFLSINQGINLNAVDALSTTAPIKFWGTSEKSNALIVNNTSVDAANFLRSDIASTTSAQFNIRSNQGLSLGADLSFNIGRDDTENTTILYSKNSDASIAIKLTNNLNNVTAAFFNSNGYVGLGPNNTNPVEALDVGGSASIDNDVIVLGDTASTSLASGSLRVAGGAAIGKSSTFGGDITVVDGQIVVNYLDSNGDPTPASVLVPGSDAGSGVYDIGSSTRAFRNIYANNFVGNFSGAFTGSLAGSISGSAARWASPTVFSLTGDVTSPGVSVDGQSNAGVAVLNATISSDLITSKTAVSTSIPTDTLLIYRSGLDSGLKKVTKQSFLSNVATVPIGAIFPFAGSTVPDGYLLCDGSEVSIGTYSSLFAIIGYTYKNAAFLIGNNTFALPDLRGRFPLGRDNMDNGQQVPDKNDPAILIDAGGGPANRVTDTTADILGQGSGTEETILDISNLPDHQHDLSTGAGQYYAGGLPGAPSDPNAVAGLGLPSSSTGQGLPRTGDILTPTTGDAFSRMNPYLTINYIIFTGVL
jgi:microcystin-dependent protein